MQPLWDSTNGSWCYYFIRHTTGCRCLTSVQFRLYPVEKRRNGEYAVKIGSIYIDIVCNLNYKVVKFWIIMGPILLISHQLIRLIMLLTRELKIIGRTNGYDLVLSSLLLKQTKFELCSARLIISLDRQIWCQIIRIEHQILIKGHACDCSGLKNWVILSVSIGVQTFF